MILAGSYTGSYKKKAFIAASIIFAVIAINYLVVFSFIPQEISIFQGDECVYDFKSPFFISIKNNNEEILNIGTAAIEKQNNHISLVNLFRLQTKKNGLANISMKILGLIPLKNMTINVLPNKKIVACGNTIGVKINTGGILIVGLSDVPDTTGKKIFPGKKCGFKPGDLITEVNNTKTNDIDDLIKKIKESCGNPIAVKIKRGDKFTDVSVRPVKSIDDKQYHLGLWVRDSTAGIGTLTFYDPGTKHFGALGHGITDVDTGMSLPLANGEILQSRIIMIKKGEKGNPGELKGVFVNNDNADLGIISKNCEYGIYGTLKNDTLCKLPRTLYPIALKNQINEGPASILADIDGKNVKEYSVEIQKVARRTSINLKGMIIKVTDPVLLNATGGIVQGMSGSPIIQDGKLIGAVTHVLINDPTRGYGIFIENMLVNKEENYLQNIV